VDVAALVEELDPVPPDRVPARGGLDQDRVGLRLGQRVLSDVVVLHGHVGDRALGREGLADLDRDALLVGRPLTADDVALDDHVVGRAADDHAGLPADQLEPAEEHVAPGEARQRPAARGG